MAKQNFHLSFSTALPLPHHPNIPDVSFKPLTSFSPLDVLINDASRINFQHRQILFLL